MLEYIFRKWRENREEFIPQARKMNHNTAKDYIPKSFYCKDLKMFLIAYRWSAIDNIKYQG